MRKKKHKYRHKQVSKNLYPWINKMQHIHIMEYYSAIKKNEIILFAGKWMKLETIMLSEISWGSERQRSYVFFHMWKQDLKDVYMILYLYILFIIYKYIYI
jgi:hypothetical protein